MTRAAVVVAICCLVAPCLALLVMTPPHQVWAALVTERPALWLSLWTSVVSLLLTMVLTTPMAWWLGRSGSGWVPLARLLTQLLVVMPPAVLGVSLLMLFGQAGLGRWVTVVFQPTAVIIAQVLVAAPLYILGASVAFGGVDENLVEVLKTLGLSRSQMARQVIVPMVLPGLLAAAGLAWARALGEFGATLMFAGNLPGSTQTLPLAIYVSMDRDMSQASGLAVVLLGLASLGLASGLVVGWRR